jgi:hypothetical protein
MMTEEFSSSAAEFLSFSLELAHGNASSMTRRMGKRRYLYSSPKNNNKLF